MKTYTAPAKEMEDLRIVPATADSGALEAASLVAGIKAPGFDRDTMIFTITTPDDYVAPSDWVEITGGS
jgi:hypothetical protein